MEKNMAMMGNMTLENYEFYMQISGAVISMLLVVVGFFVMRLINVVDALTKAVAEFKVVVSIQQEKVHNINQACDIRHRHIEERFQEIHENIRDLEKLHKKE